MDEINSQIDDINQRLDDNDSNLQDFSDSLDSNLQDVQTNLDELNQNEGQLLFPLNQDTVDLIQEQISNSSVLPSGTIVMWAGATAPTGWAICDGTNGTPDMRGFVPVGYKSGDTNFGTLNGTVGEATHTLTNAEMPNNTYLYGTLSSGTGLYTGTQRNQVGGGGAHNNIQPSIIINFIMKL